MFQLDLRSKKSIHEQIVEGFKKEIVRGDLRANDKLPSVRDLSASLTVNPNTIAKAIKTLEMQGWIYTVSGRGSFVSELRQAPDFSIANGLYNEIEEKVKELLFMGIKENDIKERISKIFEKGGSL